jgi:hypothetical protein
LSNSPSKLPKESLNCYLSSKPRFRRESNKLKVPSLSRASENQALLPGLNPGFNSASVETEEECRNKLFVPAPDLQVIG